MKEPTNADAAREVPGLRRDLGVTSLVLAQIVNIVGGAWCGTAAMAGEAHVMLWLLSALLFFLPSAIVAANLANLLPLEGGLYRWAEAAFGPLAGFLVGWNLMAYIVVSLASFGPLLTSSVAYVVGGHLGRLIDTPSGILCVSIAMLAACLASTGLGLRFGKWVHGFGAIANMIAFAAVMSIPLIVGLRVQGSHLNHASVISASTSFNVLSKMALGAFGGIEYVAIMAGECKDPRRSIVRSVWISAPLIVLMYVLGTNGVVSVVPKDAIDLIAPIPQALRLGLASTGFAVEIGVAMIAMLAIAQVGAACWQFAGAARLPMVAGWEGHAPAWIGVVSRRFGSPVRSAVLLAGIVLLLIALGEAGVGRQEAYQLLNNASQIHYAIAYFVMFAIPLVGHRDLRRRLSRASAVVAVPGLLISIAFVGFALVPLVSVVSVASFVAKMGGAVILINLLGFACFVLASKQRQRQVPFGGAT